MYDKLLTINNVAIVADNVNSLTLWDHTIKESDVKVQIVTPVHVVWLHNHHIN